MSQAAANPQSPRPNRRLFMGLGAATVGAGLGGLYLFWDRFAQTAGYGKLYPTADQATGLQLIKLPKGFTYTTFSWTKDPLSDGNPTPGAHDGMGIVKEEGSIVTLVRNHERSGVSKSPGDATCFDAVAPGGTTTLTFDTGAGAFRDAKISLSGTTQNCAGGITPWGTWLSCEETVVDPLSFDPKDPSKKPLGYQQDHGWVFEVAPEGNTVPKPIAGMGRFVHEAVCVDPTTGIVYLTEDSNPSGLYRYRPNVPGELAKGGMLEMLAADVPDLRKDVVKDREYKVRWVPIEDPTRAHSPGKLDGQGVYEQGAKQGGSAFARLEGIFYAAGRVVITATTGGNTDQGQVWEYTPGAEQMRLLFESPSKEVLNMPDNLCITPKGSVIMCEDGDRVGQRLQGLTPRGELFPFAENMMQLKGEKNGFKGDFRNLEWAGVCFSADGKWLFANLQTPGLTMAITGPWESGPF
jgi:uncharacterized protein